MTTPLALQVAREADRPLGAQIADQIRERITDGRLAGGDRVPSSRALAGDLGVARAVTEQAYTQLVAEGWLEGRHGSGTFVRSTTPLGRPTRRRRRPIGAAGPALVRLDSGTPWIDPRYGDAWRRAWRDVSTARPPSGYPDARGSPELREELAARLGRVRGLDCDPDDVIVTAGTVDGLRNVLGALPPGPVAIEDPGYRAAVATVRALGRDVVDVPALTAPDLTGTTGVYVTPAHQHPLGRMLPAGVRLALIERARTADALVIEDDYDSEFRYDVAPVPALAALDRDRVVYLGTASKTVAPSMRLGWLVAPPPLRERINEGRELTHQVPAWPVQRAFLSLLRDGYVDKVVRSAHRVYADRAARVEAALGRFGTTHGPIAGMYATIEMPAERAARAHAAAREAGYDVPLLGAHCRTARLHGLVVAFGGSVTDAQLDEVLGVLADTLAAATP
jgi:GntR family transcriptional regulator / MocR family aminotransferase